MAITVENGDILTARLEYSDGNNVGYNILHFQVNDLEVVATGLPPATALPLEDLVGVMGAAVYQFFAADWAAAAASAALFTGVTMQSIYPAPRSRPYTHQPALPTSGTLIGDPLPLQDSITVLKKTPIGQRWGLGRVYVFGLSESQQQGGEIVPGSRAALDAFAVNFDNEIPFTTGVYSGDLKPVLFAPLPPGARE